MNLLFSLGQTVKGSLSIKNLTFAPKKVSSPELDKSYLVVVLEFVGVRKQPFLTVDKLLAGFICFRVVKFAVNRIVFALCSRLTMGVGPAANVKALGLVLNV